MYRHKSDSYFWSVVLLILNEEKDAFIVERNPDTHTSDDRWLLPEIDNTVPNWTPEMAAMNLAENYGAYLMHADLEKVCTTKSDGDSLIHLFITSLYDDHMEKVFADCERRSDRHLITFHQASLTNSGLSNIHRELLIEDAELINDNSTPLHQVGLQLVRCNKSLKEKMEDFSTRPL